MRIGIDAHALGGSFPQGGNDVYWENLIRNLARIDNSNRYYIFVGGHTLLEDELKAQKNFHFVTLSGLATSRVVFALPKLKNKYRLDVLHTNYYLPFAVRCKSVVTIHDVAYFAMKEYYQGTRFLALRGMIRRSARRASAIITVSNFCKDEIIKYLNVPSHKIHVIYPGVDHLRIDHPDTITECSATGSSNLKYPEKLVLSVGNIEPKKNFGVLIKALKELVRWGYRDLSLVIAGSTRGAHIDSLRNLVGTLGLEDKVFFPGRVTKLELDELFHRATLFVYPSLYEGFGFPPFEALNAGVPTVVARSSALPEVLGEFGLYFEPNDPAGLASLMRDVLAHGSGYLATVSRVSPLFKKFLWSEAARSTLNIYEGTE